MKKVEVADLSGAGLDWAVCMVNGLKPADIYISNLGKNHTSLYRRCRDEDGDLTGSYMTGPDLLFSRKWEAMGPIIEREGLSLHQEKDTTGWKHTNTHRWWSQADGRVFTGYGATPLIAAARCYVASKLGDEVEVPEELT